MIRITVPHDTDEHLDAERWAQRVRDAAPIGLQLSRAYVDARNLVVYIEADIDTAVIEQFVDRLGFGPCTKVDVILLPIGDVSVVPTPSSRELVDVHPSELIEATTVSEDGREVLLNVRHKPYEQIDHVDVKETENTVELTVWVGSANEDARRHYVTFQVAFSTAEVVLERPLASRQIVDRP
jgi:hypothetical protein